MFPCRATPATHEGASRRSAGWRTEQNRLLRDVETHQSANRSYVEEGVQLLHLARRAHESFERQTATGKRRLLSFLLSNCVWKCGVPTAEHRQPFDMLALAHEAGGGDAMMSETKNIHFENWLPFVDAFRTSCLESGVQGTSVLLAIPQITPLFSSIATGSEATCER